MVRFRHLLVATAVAFSSVAVPAISAEWTRFRGPNGSGVAEATPLPTAWTEKDINWQLVLPGIGHSSPVIVGDKIFLTSADPSSGKRLLLRINTAGELEWKKSFDAEAHHIHTQNSFASSTPAVTEDRVYLAWATPEEFVLMAADHDGKEIWRRTLGPFISEHGFGTSPIVYQDMVIITNDQDGQSFVIAVDAATGEDRWRTPRKTRPQQSASYSAPVVYTPKGGKDQLIVNSWAHGMTSLDPQSGSVNWEIGAFHNRPVSTPILVGSLILGTCGNGGGDNSIVAVDPPERNGDQPKVAYKIPKAISPYVPSLVARGDQVFAWTDRGIVSCIDGTSGKVLKTKRIGGNFSGSPILIGDRLYAISADGDVVVVSADEELELLGKTPLEDGCRGTPAVANDVLYLRTESKLFSIGGKG